MGTDYDSHHALRTLESMSFLDVLTHDPRPAFIVDLFTRSHDIHIDPIFTNVAFLNTDGLAPVLTGQRQPDPYGQPPQNTFHGFFEWVYDAQRPISGLPFIYHGWSWTSTTFEGRWRMVNGIKEQASVSRVSIGVDSMSLPSKALSLDTSQLTAKVYDAEAEPEEHTRSPMTTIMEEQFSKTANSVSPVSEKAADKTGLEDDFLSTMDWSKTSMGPLHTWSAELRYCYDLIRSAIVPIAVFWGPEMFHLYNAPYAEFVGGKHPTILGKPAKEGYAESWAEFEPLHLMCVAAGEGTVLKNMQVSLPRGPRGEIHETYWDFHYFPYVTPGGDIPGWISLPMEITSKKIAERRLSTILDVGEATSTAQDLQDFWQQLMAGMKKNPNDIPFALLYSSNLRGSGCRQANASYFEDDDVDWELEGTIGLPPDCEEPGSRLDLEQIDALGPFFEAAINSSEPLLVECGENGNPVFDHLMGSIHAGPFHDPCQAVLILKITPTSHKSQQDNSTLGLLVLGLNTRRPYDEEYRQFIRVLNRQIATSVASVILLEEEIRRGRTIAEQARVDRNRMEQELHATALELQDRDLQLRHFTDSVPVGIFVYEFPEDQPMGKLIYRNDKFFELAGHSFEATDLWSAPMWEFMPAEEVENAKRAFYSAKESMMYTTLELRVPKSKDDVKELQWLLAYIMPIAGPDGNLRSIIGSLTDISAQKWAEDLHKQRMEEVLESKRQQEYFIDATSHEMRNPLSAMMISADEIISSLRSIQAQIPFNSPIAEHISAGVDAAQVIADCAQHQKRIVDDILTVSKIDSGLFAITPSEVQPIEMLRKMLKMYDCEFKTHQIAQQLVVSDTLDDLMVDWVLMDSSRLLQILINLVTNAIKFTKFAAVRNISMTVAASSTQPTQTPSGNNFLACRKAREDATEREEWGSGNPLYLVFSIQDTGCGLTSEAKELLFQRFAQAPRTHVNYGGSGLGLFICRELVELQGGQIGVHSDGDSRGAEFCFYVKARMAETTKEELAFPMPPPNGGESSMNLQQRRQRNGVKGMRQLILQRSSSYQQVTIPESRPGSRQSIGWMSGCSPHVLTPDSEGYPEPSPFITIPSPAVNESTTVGSITPFHALIVEDNLVNQKILARQLKKLGYRISIANHGQECLDILLESTFASDPGHLPGQYQVQPPSPELSNDEEALPCPVHAQKLASPPPTPSQVMGPPRTVPAAATKTQPSNPLPPKNKLLKDIDIVLLDSEMPVMDGLTCIRQIRAYEAEGVFQRRVPVVGITANAREEQVLEAMESGMDAVVCKPFRISEVVGVVQRIVGEVGGLMKGA